MGSLEFQGLKKVYNNGFKAVKDFNLNIKDKEFIVFVGPSGCGKSTTLRMVAGLEHISEGRLYIDNKLINDVEPKDRDIAMVFQNYALYPHMTVYDNIAFGLKMRKFPKEDIELKVRNAAKVLDIESVLKRKPKELSGGQRQRVAMGRAIVRNPKVFLMDEPLSNLDAKLRVQMRKEIAKLHKELDTTFIYVTHDQIEAMTLGTRIVVMKDGEIQQVDRPKEIYENPANLFVAGFIGNPQMNFLDGKIIIEEGKTFLNIEENKIILDSLGIDSTKLKLTMIDKEVVVGIRAEKIIYGEKNLANNSLVKLKAKIDLIENLGAELQVYGKVANKTIVMKLSDVNLNVGDEIDIMINPEDFKIFHKESGKRIL